MATAIVSGLQFVYPAVLVVLRRDPDAIRAGELWRLVTALFVQPYGVAQCVANAFLMLAFMPAAERLYGRGIVLLYFASGLVGQIANYWWVSGSGGSSTAAFGVMGGLLIYVIRNRKMVLLPFTFIAGGGLLAALFMISVRDGHGVGLLIGASIASILPLTNMSFRSTSSARERTGRSGSRPLVLR
ncbi:MAG: rhomboid family intramembrane serine protease [Steroidobacteraceae bacterium]